MKEQRYWFKRRRYGWGWTPVTWQGWLGLVACAAVIVLAAFILLPGTARSVVTSSVLEFLGVVIAAVVALLAVCIQKSPSPRWRWGKKSNDSPDEDW